MKLCNKIDFALNNLLICYFFFYFIQFQFFYFDFHLFFASIVLNLYSFDRISRIISIIIEINCEFQQRYI
jgi:hypothetical protein